jgi:hypothetical protein
MKKADFFFIIVVLLVFLALLFVVMNAHTLFPVPAPQSLIPAQ